MMKNIPHASVVVRKSTFDRLEDVRIIPFSSGHGEIFVIASLESKPESQKARELFLDEIMLHLDGFARHPNPEKDAEPRFEESMQTLNDLLKAWLEAHPGAVDIPRSGMMIGSLTGNTLLLTGFGQIASIYLHPKSDGDEAFDLVRDIRRESAPTTDKLFRTVMMGVLENGDRAFFGNTGALRLLPKEELAHILTTLPVISASETIAQKAELGQESVIGFLLKAPDKLPEAKASAKISVEELQRSEHRTEDVLTRAPRHSGDLMKIFREWLRTMLAHGSSLFLALILSLFAILAHAVKVAVVAPFGPGRREKAKQGFAKALAERKQLIADKNSALTWPMRIAYALIVIALFAAAIAAGKSLSQRKMAELDTAREKIVADIRSLEGDAEAKLIYRDDAGAKIALDAADKLMQEHSELSSHADWKRLGEELVRLRKELRKEYMLGVSPAFTLTAKGLRLGFINKKLAAVTEKGGLVIDGVEAADTTLEPKVTWFGTDLAYSLDGNGTISSIAPDGSVKTLQGVAPNTLIDATMYSGRVYGVQPVASSIVRMDPSSGGFATARTWQKGEVKSLSGGRSIAIDSDVYVALKDSILKFRTGVQENFKLGTIDPALTDIVRIWTSETSNFIYILEPSAHRIVVIDKGNGAYVKQFLFDGLDGVTDFLVNEPSKQFFLLAGTQVLVAGM